MLTRGPLFKGGGEIDNRMSYILVTWLVEVSKMFKLKSKTFIAAIDLLERYLAHYEISKANLQLLVCTCLMISSKMVEIYAPEINDFVHITDKAYTSQQFKEMELLVCKRCNYIVMSCDIDDYAYLVKDFTQKDYPKFKNLYLQIATDRKYPGIVPYSEIFSYMQAIINM